MSLFEPLTWSSLQGRGIYQYEPLSKDENQIRIFSLFLPAASSTCGDVLQGCFEIYSLSNNADTIPSFTALSYTWGPAEDAAEIHEDKAEHLILINGQKHFIRDNLLDGLLEIRRRSVRIKPHRIPLWIDAISINQSDTYERGWQVDIMGSVFSRAARVLVWLGRADNAAMQRVRQMITNAAKLIREIFEESSATDMKPWVYWENTVIPEDRFSAAGLPPPPETSIVWNQNGPNVHTKDRDWWYFAAFMERRWWSRVWALQEVMLANNVEFWCGNTTIEESDLHNCSHLIFWETYSWLLIDPQRSKQDPAIAFRYAGSAMTKVFRLSREIDDPFLALDEREVAVFMSQNSSKFTRQARLMYLLDGSRSHEATNPRDYIYALLGLIADRDRPLRLKLKAQYEREVRDVFLDAVKFIVNDEWLGVLTFVDDRPGHSFSDLPSFVPAFGGDLHLSWTAMDADKVWQLSRDLSLRAPIQGKPSFRGRNLHLHGICIGTIIATSVPTEDFFPVGALTPFEGGAAFLADSCDEIYPYTGQPRLEAVWRALLQGDPDWMVRDLMEGFSAYWLHRILRVLYREQANVGRAAAESMKQSVFAPGSPLALLASSDSSGHFPRLDHLDGLPDDQHYGLNHPVAEKLSEKWSVFHHQYQRNRFRRLFRTDRGHLGTGRTIIREGDSVWVFARSPCPFVLRKLENQDSGNRYRLIGWAYVHGYANGDVVEKMGNDWEHVVLV